MDTKYLILGAGASGISFGLALKASGINDFIILEKNKDIGGLCGSAKTKLGTCDIGGGHLWCTKYKEVEKLVKKIVPSWHSFERKTSVLAFNHEIGYPIEDHIWQLPIELSANILIELKEKPSRSHSDFEDWTRSTFGDILSNEYMIPYNEKLWGKPISRMSLDWLHKLPSPKFKDVLMSVLARKPANKPFFSTWDYPTSGGFQSIIDALANPIKDHIIVDSKCEYVDLNLKKANGIGYEFLVNSIPWKETKWLSNSNIPEIDILEAVPLTVSLHQTKNSFKADGAQWTYIPDLNIPHHRMFFSSRWMPEANFDFSECNSNRFQMNADIWFNNVYAYPVQTCSKKSIMADVADWSLKNNIIPIGRWGKWEYWNSDVCIMDSIKTASSTIKLDYFDIMEKITNGNIC